MLEKVHHLAIIASDIEVSKRFYCDVLGFTILAETYRFERDSWKVDLALNGNYLIELFSFPDAPARVNQPEARGLELEAVRVDELTGSAYTFFKDPDGLPIELVEIKD